MMPGSSSDAFQTVFRDLPTQETPRVLVNSVKPGRPALERGGLEEIRTEGPVSPSTSIELAPTPSPQEEGFRVGYAAGIQKGVVEGRKIGHQEAFDQGMAEGREKGTQEALQRLQASQNALDLRVETLNRLMSGLEAQLDRQITARLEAAEEDMVALCYTILCRLLGDRALRRDRVIYEVQQAIEQCCRMGSHVSLAGLLAIHVRPGDMELLQADPGFAQWFGEHRHGPIPWVADDQVELGGCIVRSMQGSLDARLETQFQSLRRLILEAFPEDATQPEGPPASILEVE